MIGERECTRVWREGEVGGVEKRVGGEGGGGQWGKIGGVGMEISSRDGKRWMGGRGVGPGGGVRGGSGRSVDVRVCVQGEVCWWW